MQLRASIPFYWANIGTNKFKPGIAFYEKKNEGFRATLEHFKNLNKRYGRLCF